MRFLILAAALLLQTMFPPPLAPNRELASVLEGELAIAGCPLDSMLVAARVWDNRGGTRDGWYGWREPGQTALTVSAVYRLLPDRSEGATFFIERSDRLKMPFLNSATLVQEWLCRNGSVVQAWRE